MLKSSQFKVTKIFPLLALSAALNFPHISFAGFEDEHLSDNAISKLGHLASFPKKLIQQIGANLGKECSDIKVAMTNTVMFTAITGCTEHDLKTPVFPQLITASVSGIHQKAMKISPHTHRLFEDHVGSRENFIKACTQYGETLNFNLLLEKKIFKMPAYIWKHVVRKVEYLPQAYWPFLKGTQIHTLDFADTDKIGPDEVLSLGQNLKGTNVLIVELQYNNLTPDSVRGFAQELKKDTKVHTINLTGNQISIETQQELMKDYPHIKWIF